MKQMQQGVLVLLTGLTCMGVATTANAQPIPVGQTVVQMGITGLTQFKTGLNGGGDFDWQDYSGRLNVKKRVDTHVTAGFDVDYSYQKWNWQQQPTALGGTEPWGAINSTKLGLTLSYSPSADLHFTVAPTIKWAGESGVGTANSAIYGSLFSVTKTFSPSFTLGLGAGVFRELDKTSAFPFLVVHWRINDRLTLKNPLPAGPSGGAGLELEYQATDRWTVGVGGAWRNYRYRLNNSGPFAGGIGQNRMIPLFARVSYAFTPTTSVDLYAFANVAGNVQAQSADKSVTLNTGYNTGLGLGLNLSHRF